jgi:hypothetical protein
MGGWVSPTAGLNHVEKRKFLTLPGLEIRPLRRPTRSQSLYRLSYPGTCTSLLRKLNRNERSKEKKLAKERTKGKTRAKYLKKWRKK